MHFEVLSGRKETWHFSKKCGQNRKNMFKTDLALSLSAIMTVQRILNRGSPQMAIISFTTVYLWVGGQASSVVLLQRAPSQNKLLFQNLIESFTSFVVCCSSWMKVQNQL